MTTHEHRELATAARPDFGFRVAVAFYAGVVVAGIGSAAAIGAGAESATVLSLFPSTVTITLLAGFVLANRSAGLAERLGRSRRRRLAWYLPPAVFASGALGYAIVPIALDERLLVLSLVLAAVTVPLALGIARMARNRYVAAITPDEPDASWTWHDAGVLSASHLGTAMLMLVTGIGLVSVAAGYWFGLFWIAYGVIVLYSTRTDSGVIPSKFEPSNRWNPPTLYAHEVGLVVEKPFSRTLVPWDDIGGVRLTEDELVCERRWRDIRCDRDAIDDPEAVREGIERARQRSNRRIASDP
ncbi:PH domain-containing protein [Natrialbaceae archaeon A-arb3/5]